MYQYNSQFQHCYNPLDIENTQRCNENAISFSNKSLNKMSSLKYTTYKKYYIKPIKIICNQSKTQIDENITKILQKYCNLGVYGYNTSRDEYWGKKYESKKCVLYFKLKIKSLDDDNSSIIIFPEFESNEIEINNLEKILQKFLVNKNVNNMCVKCQYNELYL
jgi:hypothetical protein